MLDLFELMFGHEVPMSIMEDNLSTILIARKGYSPKLRHVLRTHKINLGSLRELFDSKTADIAHCPTQYQAADVFTKELQLMHWPKALA